MNAGNLRRIERLNYLIGGVLVIAAAVTQTQRIALGLTCGVVLTCLNFFFLRRLVTKWTQDAADGKSTSGASMLVLPKMVGLMVAVVLCLALLPIEPVAFVVGYSIFVVSIFVEITLVGVMSVLRPAPASSEQDPE